MWRAEEQMRYRQKQFLQEMLLCFLFSILSWMLKRQRPPNVLEALPGLVHRSQMSLVDHAG